MVKGVRLIYNTSYVFIEVRPDTTFLNCIQQFLAKQSIPKEELNRSSIILKYNGRVLNENDLVTSLGKENNYDIQVDIKYYGNSLSSYKSPVTNSSVSGITHASAQSLSKETSPIQIFLFSMLNTCRYVQEVYPYSTIGDIASNIRQHERTTAEVIIYDTNEILNPLKTISSLSLSNGSILFVLFIPEYLNKPMPYYDITFEGSNSKRLRSLIMENKPSLLQYLHIRYKLQSVDSIFQIIRVLVNLSGDFLNTITFTDESSKVEIIPSSQSVEVHEIKRFSEISIPWFLFERLKITDFLSQLFRIQNITVKVIRFSLIPSRIKPLSDCLTTFNDLNSFRGVVLINGNVFSYPRGNSMIIENESSNNQDIVANLNHQLSDVMGKMRSQESKIQNLQNELSSSKASTKRILLEVEAVKKKASEDRKQMESLIKEKEKQISAIEESASQMRIVIDNQKKRISELSLSSSIISSPNISMPSPAIEPLSLTPKDDVKERYEIVSTILTDVLEYVDTMERESEKLCQKMENNKLLDQLKTTSQSMQSCSDKLCQKIKDPSFQPVLKEMRSLASQVGGSALNATKLCNSIVEENKTEVNKKGDDLREKITAFLPHSAMYMADVPVKGESVKGGPVKSEFVKSEPVKGESMKKKWHYSRKSRLSKSNPASSNVKDNAIPDPKRQKMQ